MGMSKGSPRNLPKGITPKTRTKDGKVVPVITKDGTPVYRVRVWDAVLKRQIERTAEGLDAAKALLTSSTRRSVGLDGWTPSGSASWTWQPATSSPTRSGGTARPGRSRRWRKSGRSSTST